MVVLVVRWTILAPGLLYTDWEAGPWWGLKSKDREGVQIGWINLGDTGYLFFFLSFFACGS